MAELLKVITYEGVLGIERAEEMKNQLASLLENVSSLIINLSRVDWIDLSILQVLLSAKKTANEKKVKLQFHDQLSEAVAEAFYSSGISPSRMTSGHALNQVMEDFLQGKR